MTSAGPAVPAGVTASISVSDTTVYMAAALRAHVRPRGVDAGAGLPGADGHRGGRRLVGGAAEPHGAEAALAPAVIDLDGVRTGRQRGHRVAAVVTGGAVADVVRAVRH